MKKSKKIKQVHEGHYVAKVEVELLEYDTGWPPYLSIQDAYKLSDVRRAIRKGDFESAAKYGRIYELHPVVHQ